MLCEWTNDKQVRSENSRPEEAPKSPGFMTDRVDQTSPLYLAMCMHACVYVCRCVSVNSMSEMSLRVVCLHERSTVLVSVFFVHIPALPPTRQPVSLPSEVHLPLKQLPQGIPAARSPV